MFFSVYPRECQAHTPGLFPTILLLLVCVACFSCSRERELMRNGYYTAEATSFDAQGWKEFLTIYVYNNKIVTVEYNSRNSSGFIRTWDMDHMRDMKARTGGYPTKYTREYATALLNRQSPESISPIPGGEDFYLSFKLLAEAAITRAITGNSQTALVELPGRGAERKSPDNAQSSP